MLEAIANVKGVGAVADYIGAGGNVFAAFLFGPLFGGLEQLRSRADVILAVDTTVGPMAPRGMPDPWENLFATIQVMSHTIVREKLKRGAPDILIRPELSTFRLLDFFHASAILRAAEPVKAQMKERLGELM